jgi:hypothetical protein
LATHFVLVASHALLVQLESTLHVWPSPTPTQLPELLHCRPPLSVHAVPAVAGVGTQVCCAVHVRIEHAEPVAGQSVAMVHATHLPLPSQTLPPLSLHGVRRGAAAVSQQFVVHAFVRQSVDGVGHSPAVVHEAAPASQSGDEGASLAAESLTAESTSASGPGPASESPGEPSLVASTSASGITLASESPGEPSLVVESGSASGVTLASESSDEPSLLDDPPPLLDPELLPELELALPLDPPLLLEDTDASSPVSSPVNPGLELPQLAASKRAAPMATTLATCFDVGRDRSGMAHSRA